MPRLQDTAKKTKVKLTPSSGKKTTLVSKKITTAVKSTSKIKPKKPKAVTLSQTKKITTKKVAPKSNRAKAKRKANFWIKNKQLLWITAAIITTAICVGLGYIGFSGAEKRKDDIISKFNKNNFELISTTDLKANFIEVNKPDVFSFDFEVVNDSEYTYPVDISATLPDLGDRAYSSETYTIRPGTSRKISLEIPLSFKGQDGESLTERINIHNLEIKLDTEIKPNRFLAKTHKTLSFEFPITTYLFSEKELIDLKVDLGGAKNIVYTPEGKPTVLYEIALINLTDQEIVPAYFEVNLVDLAGNFVQPLGVAELSLAANKFETQRKQHTFTLPPANQIGQGTQAYKLELKYIGNINSRKFELKTVTKEDLTIAVERI